MESTPKTLVRVPGELFWFILPSVVGRGPIEWCPAFRSCRLDGVHQQADLLDFHFTHIAVFHEQRRLAGKDDAGRGSHHQNVARLQGEAVEIGRASVRERLCQYVSISLDAATFNKTN